MAEQQVRAVGIAWFNADDYDRARRIMVDKHKLPLSYAEWQKLAERTERELKAKGAIVYRAVIDPETFPAWCTVRGLDIDAKGRMSFANDFAYRQIGQTH